MTASARLVFLLAPCWFAACAFRAPMGEQPAVIVDPDQTSRAELTRAVSELLNGVPVTLAGDALTQNNQLIIERAARRDANGNLIMGFQTELPHEFRLVKIDGKCILIDAQGEERRELKQTRCEPIKGNH